MNSSIGGWPLTGILAAIAIVVGVALLVVYAMRRGLVDSDLPGTIESEQVPTSSSAPAGAPAHPSRALGGAGAVFLVVGLALGLLTAAGSWSSEGDGTGGSSGCAQSWNGCPPATAQATSAPSLPSIVP